MKTRLSILLVTLLSLNMAYGAGEYFEAQTGLANNSYGFRLGASQSWDKSLGYSQVFENSAGIHTISYELYRNFYFHGVELKVGGGLGYSIPNPQNEWKADNDISYIAGIGAERRLFDSPWSLGLSLKGLFFTTDARRTDYGSHTETLSTGQQVEVLDTYHYYDSINYDKVILGLFVRYYF